MNINKERTQFLLKFSKLIPHIEMDTRDSAFRWVMFCNIVEAGTRSIRKQARDKLNKENK